MTSVRGLGSYTVPKVDVLVSANLPLAGQCAAGCRPSVPTARRGPAIYRMTAAQFQAATGRPLAPGLATQDVDLLLPGAVYGDRINVVDMRIAKVLRFGRTKANVGLDLYNLFNCQHGDDVRERFTILATNGAKWMTPTAVLLSRFMRFNVQVDF